MNAQETLQLLAALRACRASHFKSQDFEITMSPAESSVTTQEETKATDIVQAQPDTSVVENKEATEKLKGLIATLQLSPEQLLDVVMPAGAGG